MNFSLPPLRAIGIAAACYAMPHLALAADTFDFAADDLLLGVQASSGTGVSQNLFFKLGNTVTIKNNPNQGVVGNIGVDLANTFGNDWFSRAEVLFGVVGNRTGLNNAGVPPQEPGRIFYISTPTTVAGTSSPLGPFNSASLASAGNAAYGSLRTVLTQGDPLNTDDEFTATASGATILDQATQPTSWQNSWTRWNPPGGAPGFSIFTGGIQNEFGKAIPEVLVDIQRLAPSAVGTYVTTVGISANGAIRLFAAATSSPFDQYIASFPSITAPADKLPNADPDADGATNLQEFGFGGDPSSGADSGIRQALTLDANGDSLRDISLTLEVRSGATFTASGNDLVSAAIDQVIYRIEGSTDLVTWDSPVSEVTPVLGSGTPSSGYVLKTFRLNGGNGLAGKGFLRAMVVK